MMLHCQNEGCQSGRSFEIDPKQVEWFEKRGLSLPKSCPDCREWKRAQKDEITTCNACKVKRRITARQKIGFHRYKGVWEPPTLCRPCELHPERGERLGERGREKSGYSDFYKEPSRRSQTQTSNRPEVVFEDFLPEGQTEVIPINVLAKAEVYERIRDREHGNALEHIVGKKHGDELMKAYGISDKQGVLNRLMVVAKSSDPERVYEFKQDDGRTIKYDRKYGVMMVIIPNELPPPNERILTAYPKTPNAIATQISKGRWKPQKKGKVV